MADAALKSEPSAAPVSEALPAIVALPSSKAEQSIEQARQEIEEKLRAYRPPYNPAELPANQLNGKYLIKTDQPLPEFNRLQSQAFTVTDLAGNSLPYYAAICDPALPYRHTSSEKLTGYDHPHLIRLIDRGIVHLQPMGEQRYVLLFEKPQGRSLSQLMAEGINFSEQSLREQVLTPLSSVLTALEELGISHCNIHPSTIFLGEKLVLGECISGPAGFSQDYLYEPVERIAAVPQGKGAGSLKVDVYAIGVLVIEVLYNLTRMRALSQPQIISLLLQQGCHNTLIGNAEFSEYFNDLLRGSLCDDPIDRWGPTQLAQWITGKRFNIIHPSTPREASRPFHFEGRDFFNRKALAHALCTQWDAAKNFIRGAKLERWLEQSIQQPEDADLLSQAINYSGSASKNSRRTSDLLTRALIIIDPAGPIRSEHLAFNTDAIGKMISEAMYHKRQADLNILIEVMLNDLPHYWGERQRGRLINEVQEAVWKLQTVRPALNGTGFGFGVERCLYDLNHDLPCYSAQLKDQYVTTLPRMMQVLDALATTRSKEFSLMDRHLAAFVASRANINNEIRFTEIAAYAPELAKSRELHVLQLFARAQEKSGINDLPGLTCYAALILLGLLQTIHSRKIRDTLSRRIREAVDEGRIQSVINALLDLNHLERDHAGYGRAREMFLRNQLEINRLRDGDALKKKVRDRGHRWASLVSVFLFLITCAYVIRDFMR